MARNIQAISGAGREAAGAFWRGLAGIAIWLAVAAFFPFETLHGLDPRFDPFIPWLPAVAYVLALFGLIQALRGLGRLVNTWLRQDGSNRGLPAASARVAAAKAFTARQSSARQSPARQSPARDRPQQPAAPAQAPTVQRMR